MAVLSTVDRNTIGVLRPLLGKKYAATHSENRESVNFMLLRGNGIERF